MITLRKLGTYGPQVPLDEQKVQTKLINPKFTALSGLAEGINKDAKLWALSVAISAGLFLPSNKYCKGQLRINKAATAAALSRDLSPEQVAQVITTSILEDWKNV